MTELLLMYAARNEHILTYIKPKLEAGHIVITDRYVDASYAYQGSGRHIEEDKLKQLDTWIVQSCMPDLTLWLKAPVDLCLDRVFQRGNNDRFDEESASFFVATQLGYQKRAEADPERFHVIDATQKPDAIYQSAEKAILSRVNQCMQRG